MNADENADGFAGWFLKAKKRGDNYPVDPSAFSSAFICV